MIGAIIRSYTMDHFLDFRIDHTYENVGGGDIMLYDKKNNSGIGHVR